MKFLYKLLFVAFTLVIYIPIEKAMEVEPPKKSPEEKLAELKARENEIVFKLRQLGEIGQLEELGYARRRPAAKQPGETLEAYRIRLEKLQKAREEYAAPTTARGRLGRKTGAPKLLNELQSIQAQKKKLQKE